MKVFNAADVVCLARGRSRAVPGEGNPRSKIMIVGEGPGQEEDREGRPFVGPAGQLLTKMLQAIALDRREVFITNRVKCRPPGNRNPEPEELRGLFSLSAGTDSPDQSGDPRGPGDRCRPGVDRTESGHIRPSGEILFVSRQIMPAHLSPGLPAASSGVQAPGLGRPATDSSGV